MDKITDELIKKINLIHESTIVMKETLNTLKDQVTRQNSRVSKLEETQEVAVRSSATFEERLSNHMSQDEKEQLHMNQQLKEMNEKLDGLSRTVWIGIGILTMVSLLWPYFANKLFE